MISHDELQDCLGRLLMGELPESLESLDPALLVTDSRTIETNQWFVPLVGDKFDGHSFIVQAMARDAAGFLYERNRLPSACKEMAETSGICVSNTTKAIQAIARYWRGKNQSTKIVAVTGSAGKTTTKALLTEMLSVAGNVHSAKGSYNNEIGVPMTLLELKEEHDFCVLEFGARHKGDIAFLTQLANPDVGCLLNAGNAHVGEFGSREILLETKAEIFEELREQGIQIANADDPRLLSIARNTRKKFYSFGFNDEANVVIKKEEWQDEVLHLEFDLRSEETNQTFSFDIDQGNSAYGQNIAAAIACCYALGVNPDTLRKSLDHFIPPKGRFRQINALDKIIIDDCYNANPASMQVGISSVVKRFPESTFGFFLGDMLELGRESESCHRNVGEQVASISGLETLITVGVDSELIGKEALSSGFKGKILHFDTVEDLLPEWKTLSQKVDVVYVKGSNSLDLSKLINDAQSNPTG